MPSAPKSLATLRPSASASPGPLASVTFDDIVRVCLRPGARDQWRVLRAFPHLLGSDLTDEEFLWCRVQLAIDDGFGECGKCRKLGYGPYCQHCGHMHGTPVSEHDQDAGTCLQCQTTGRLVYVQHSYCNHCGTPTDDAKFLQRLKAGMFSYDDLNESTRVKVTENERRAIENGFGGPLNVDWDK